MSHENVFNQLCSKTSEVITILKHNECNLSDDTYLDHLIIGIKDELLQHKSPSKRIEFWKLSNCSNFAQTFGDQSNETQNFLLKLLKEVWTTHCDIQRQCLEVICDCLKSFRKDHIPPNQNFLDIVKDLVFHKRPEKLLLPNLNLLMSNETNLWDVFLKPIFLSLGNDLPQSHFWKESLVLLAKEFIISCIFQNEESRVFSIKFLYPDLAFTQMGIRVFSEILDFFLNYDGQLPDMTSFHCMLRAFVKDESSVKILRVNNKIKALVILQDFQEAGQCLLQKKFLLKESKSSIQLWYKSVKPLLESEKMKTTILDDDIMDCVFKNLKIINNQLGSSSDVLLTIQCLSNIKMSNRVQILFHNEIFKILNLIKIQTFDESIDLSSATNIQLIQSSINALIFRAETTLNMDQDRLKILSELSKNSYLSTHLKSQVLYCIRSMVECMENQPNKSTDVSIHVLMLELWQHSLFGCDWRTKELLISILSTAFNNKNIKLTNEVPEENIEFPWTCLINFVNQCLDDDHSFIRSSSVTLLSSIYQYIGDYKDTKWMNTVQESLKGLFPNVVHLFRNDTEAIVRRTILRDGVLSYLYKNSDIGSSLLDKDYQEQICFALNDFDWEVKEEAIKCLDYILQALFDSSKNIKEAEAFVNKLRQLCVIKALNTCLADYEPRFLHKTYLLLQKLRHFLLGKFSIKDLEHKCGNACCEYDTFPSIVIKNQSKVSEIPNETKSDTREDVICDILDEEKSYLMAKRFKLDKSRTCSISQSKGDQSKYKGSDNINESQTVKDKPDKDYCVRQFIQYVTFDINLELRLQEYDKYHNKLNSLDSVLDDILSSVSEKNLIDGIDCY